MYPPYSATDSEYCNLLEIHPHPSTVGTPHFLDCISSSAYTNTETPFCDPGLGIPRINFEIRSSEVRRHGDGNITVAETSDVYGRTCYYI